LFIAQCFSLKEAVPTIIVGEQGTLVRLV